jgi:hypothetical protein
VREVEHTEEVEAQQREDANPECEERLTVEDVPAVSEVGH